MNEWDGMFNEEEKKDKLLGAKIAQMLNGISAERAIFILEQVKKLILAFSGVNVDCNEFSELICAWEKTETNS
jgi:hypothetical protein